MAGVIDPLGQSVDQWKPEELMVERAMPDDIVKRLEAMGHAIDRIAPAGVTQAVEIDSAGNLAGVHDPRVPGKAATGKRRSSEE